MIDQHHFTSKHSSPLFSSPLVYFLTFCLFCHFCLLCFSFPFHLLSSYFFLLKQVISSKPSFSIRIDKNKDKSFPRLARKCPEQLSCQYPYNRALVITSITLNSSKMIKDTITRRGKIIPWLSIASRLLFFLKQTPEHDRPNDRNKHVLYVIFTLCISKCPNTLRN